MKKEIEEKSQYRQRIYSRYAFNIQDAGPTFEEDSALRWARAYLYYLRDWLPKDAQAQILDVACGGGKLLYTLKNLGYHSIEGVDISLDQVQLARNVVANVTEADAIVFLDENRESFDLITGLDIIEHFHKPEVLRFLDVVYAALKPGGRVVLQTPNADSPWGTMQRYNDFTHEVAFNPNALTRLMKLTGFQGIESREMGPVPIGYSPMSTMRYIIWRIIRGSLKLWNLAETGDSGSGVFTRVFMISGIKR